MNLTHTISGSGKNILTCLAVGLAALMFMLFPTAAPTWAGADPAFSFYGYQEIVPNPNPAIVNENTHVTVTVSNSGDTVATNVRVKLSFNDWGVTFQGWQEIGTVTIPSIPTGGSALAEFDYVFENRAHTCLEALVISADQNTDTNNDRGQINMEVVNAGESFEYYVPIVNNGDGDIDVQVRGECRVDQGGAVADALCRPVDQGVVNIPAGEEVLIPVAVEFFPGTPRGTPVDIYVDAFDVLKPGDVHAMNHVVVRVIHNTARGLKEDALAMLGTLPPPPGTGKGKSSNALANKIEQIAGHIEKSLDGRLWMDDFRLHPNGLSKVYAQELSAVSQLLKLMERENLSMDWKKILDACLRALTDADRILLQTAIKDAGGDPDAESFLQQGDDMRQAGAHAEANRFYHHGHVTILK